MRLIVQLTLLGLTEVAFTVFLTSYWGALRTYSLFATLSIIGLTMQWLRRSTMQSAWRKIYTISARTDSYNYKLAMTEPDMLGPQVEVYTYWASIFLLLIPGPFTAALGFVFMLPPAKIIYRIKLAGSLKKTRRRLEEWKAQQPEQLANPQGANESPQLPAPERH